MRANKYIKARLVAEGFVIMDLGAGKAPCLFREGAPENAPYVHITASQGDRDFHNSDWAEADTFQVVCMDLETLEEPGHALVHSLDEAITRAKTMLDEFCPVPQVAAPGI